jgi:hypothetical protein
MVKRIKSVPHDWLEADEGRCRWCVTPFRRGGCGSYQIAAFYGPGSVNRPFEWYPPVADTCSQEVSLACARAVASASGRAPSGE